MAELRPYNPTFRDRLAALLIGEARPGSARANFAEGVTGSRGIGTTGAGLVDFTPAAIPLSAQEAHRSAMAGDAVGAATNAMAVIPGVKYPVTTTSAPVKALSQKHPSVNFALGGGDTTPLVVNKVVVPPDMRGQGVGTAFMNDVISYADQEGKMLALSPSADFGGKVRALEEWYRSLGFVPNKGRSRDFSTMESYVRNPKTE